MKSEADVEQEIDFNSRLFQRSADVLGEAIICTEVFFMSAAMERHINDAFRVLNKRVLAFARRHSSNYHDAEDLAGHAMEQALLHFQRLSQKIEVTEETLPTLVKKMEKRAAIVLKRTRIDHYRRREVARRFYANATPEVIASTWLKGTTPEPAPDQRLIVAEQLKEVLKHSMNPRQRHLAETLQRHMEAGDFDLSPAELAREANESASCRHGWARKLESKGIR